ncbi:hypothetical protein ACF0H5_009597 [Mactra antiquata]
MNHSQHPESPQNITSTWDSNLSDVFLNNIDIDRIHTLNSYIDHESLTRQTIEHATTELQDIFEDSANRTFNIKKYNFTKNNKKSWFGHKCNLARNNYHNAKKCYQLEPSETNKLRLRDASKHYKRTLDYYIKKEKHNNSVKLRKLNESNPKKYWKFLKNIKPNNTKKASPSLDEFYHHFKSVNESTIPPEAHFDHNEDVANFNSDCLNMKITPDEVHKSIKKPP